MRAKETSRHQCCIRPTPPVLAQVWRDRAGAWQEERSWGNGGEPEPGYLHGRSSNGDGVQLLVKLGEDHSSYKISLLPTSNTALLTENVFSGKQPSACGISGFWISKTNALLERLTHAKSRSTRPLGIIKLLCQDHVVP